MTFELPISQLSVHGSTKLHLAYNEGFNLFSDIMGKGSAQFNQRL